MENFATGVQDGTYAQASFEYALFQYLVPSPLTYH
jgi:hypothetical protein